jgi:lysophospholipid acyltransferase (LPLAT)-like uncharacterized protein
MTGNLKKNLQVYQFSDLSQYSFRQKLLVRTAGFVFYVLVNLIGKTLRFETEGWENYEQIERDGKLPIYTFWHNRLFSFAYFWRRRKIVLMVSPSLDGNILSRLLLRQKFGVSRGSSSRGGKAALDEMISAMEQGIPGAITIDGPKGPKYVAKLGAALLAKKTGNPVMPFSIEIKNYWEIKSWDRLQIPKPFSRAKLLIAEPIYVSGEANGEEFENKQLEVQTALDELVSRGVQWRESEK